MRNCIFIPLLSVLTLASCEHAPKAENDQIEKPFKQSTMKNQDFTASIRLNASPEEAYRAIKDFRAWWSEDIEGPTDQVGETFFYHYKDIHLCKMKLIEADENKKLVYKVLDNEFNFIEDQSEWVNSKLIFEIKTEGDQTKVEFTHQGLTPEDECFEVCNEAWTNYITNSLYKLITEGKGTPNPKDKEGYNAELAKKWKLD